MKLLAELRRRKVFRVAAAYAVVAWGLAQVADLVLENTAAPNWVMQVLLLLLALGFPLAIVLAWAFEVTPEGVRRTERLAEGAEAPSLSGQDRVLIVLLTGVIVIAAYQVVQVHRTSNGESPIVSESSNSGPSTAPSNRADAASIAVLPFADLSPDGDQGYFSDGIAEEILNVLSRIESLNVTSRTSAFAFKSQSELSIRDIAAELEVRHVLEGSVRKAADTIRVTAQLIDAESDLHLWSETYDRRLTAENVFSIQDEIAAAITDQLASRLGVSIGDTTATAGGTDDIDAYEAFLAGRENFINRNYENLPLAIDLLEQAVAADPEFSRAHGWLAMAYVVSPSWGFFDRDYKDLARRSAERAMQNDPENVAAMTALAFITREKPLNDYVSAIELYERAIAIDPQFTTAHAWLSQSWRNLGFFDKADRAVERCLEADPEYPICIYTYSEIASMQGRYEASIDRLKKIFETSHQEAYPQFLGTVHANGDEMLLYLMLRELADMIGPGTRWMVPDLLRALSDETYDRMAALDRLEARIRSERAGFRQPDPYISTAYYLAFGAFDRISNEDGEATGWWWFKGYPGMTESPARKEAMRIHGIPQYWRTHGYPPQCRPIGHEDFECD